MERTKIGKLILWMGLIVSVVLLLAGCAATKATIVKHPDAPMLLLEDVTALVAVEDPPGSAEFVEYGRTTLHQGQTVSTVDWQPIGDGVGNWINYHAGAAVKAFVTITALAIVVVYTLRGVNWIFIRKDKS